MATRRKSAAPVASPEGSGASSFAISERGAEPTTALNQLSPDIQALVEKARQVQARAWAPYSNFHVGAAIVDGQGGVHVGCNVENVSFGGTVCAERNAVAAAVAAGRRDLKLCVVTVQIETPATPCGFCRQVLAEFNPSIQIVCVGASGKVLQTSLDVLLPGAFTPAQLNETRRQPGRGATEPA
jgi:cytidine deaminase